MKGISVETDVKRELGDVFDYLTQIENQTAWMEMIDSVEHTGGNPGEPGATYKQVSKMMGQTIEGSLEIVESEASGTIVTRAASGPMKIESLYELSEKDGGTHIKMTVDPGPAGAMMGPMLRKQLKATIDALQVELEK
jgi:carbon monoxide dehydrogenase subunit G